MSKHVAASTVSYVLFLCLVGYSVAVGEFTGDSEQGENF